MQEFFSNIINAVLGIWRFRWTALIITWLVSIIGWSAVALIDYRYTASARVYVDTNNVLAPLLKGITVQPDVAQRVSLVSQALLTRPNIRLLAAESGLDKTATSKEELERLYAYIEQNIEFSPLGRDETIYIIEFQHKDPQVSKVVVEKLMSIFIDSSLNDEKKNNDQAQQFLDERIEEYQARLLESEMRLTRFKRKNAGVMPSEAGGFYQRLQQATNDLRMSRSALREATNRRDELSRQLDKESPSVYSVGSSGTALRISELQSELDTLLQRYTPLHPRAQQLRDSLDALKVQLEEEARQPGQLNRLRQDNVVYQNLRPIVAEAQATVAELSARVADYEAQVRDLESAVDSIPVVEAELKQLNRDYETVKDQHDMLLMRRESARLSELERGDDESKFRVIEPPVLPKNPSSPNKLLLNLAVLAMALGTGFGVAILLSIFNPVYFEQRTLQLQTGLPVFGSVTKHQSKAALYKHKMMNFIYYIGLIMLPVILLVILIIGMSGGTSPEA